MTTPSDTNSVVSPIQFVLACAKNIFLIAVGIAAAVCGLGGLADHWDVIMSCLRLSFWTGAIMADIAFGASALALCVFSKYALMEGGGFSKEKTICRVAEVSFFLIAFLLAVAMPPMNRQSATEVLGFAAVWGSGLAVLLVNLAGAELRTIAAIKARRAAALEQR